MLLHLLFGQQLNLKQHSLCSPTFVVLVHPFPWVRLNAAVEHAVVALIDADFTKSAVHDDVPAESADTATETIPCANTRGKNQERLSEVRSILPPEFFEDIFNFLRWI